MDYANIDCMKDYIIREKLRIRAYNALVDYLGILIRKNHSDYDRILEMKQDDDEWIHVIWEDKNDNKYESTFDFSVIVQTQLLSGDDAVDAPDIGSIADNIRNKDYVKTKTKVIPDYKYDKADNDASKSNHHKMKTENKK